MGTATGKLRTILGFILPLAIVACGVAAYIFIKSTPPDASKRPAQRSQVAPVEAVRLTTQDYTVHLRSFGSVVPRQQTDLVAQVSGVVAEVSESFRVGRLFSKGDVLLTLDSSNYTIAVRSAEAAVVQARAQYTEERARGEQAASDWKRLGKRGKPGALLLRTPQRQAAKAQEQSAKAQLDRAKLDLSRTEIKAPYDGQVLSTAVDEGRFVTVGSALGVVFASGALDVRLPLSSSQLQHIDLQAITDGGDAAVELVSEGGSGQRFMAQLVRSEGQIDVRTRQLFVVAEIAAGADLAVGQFVEAKLSGKTYTHVFVVPEQLLLPEGDVFLVEDGRVKRAPVELIYSDGEEAAVSGLSIGDVLVLTPLGNAVTGMRVSATIDGVLPLRSGRTRPKEIELIRSQP